MLSVKICGVTRIEDAEFAIAAGADALGLNFYAKSPRSIDLARAKEIHAVIGSRATKVGVFVDATEQDVLTIAREAGLDAVQLHGEMLDPERLRDRGLQAWRAVRCSPALTEQHLESISAAWDRIVFDAFHPTLHGGTGLTISDDAVQMISDLKLWTKSYLSGGLTPENVAEKLRGIEPFGVDVASGVESAPGIKDPEKVRTFIERARAL